MLYFLQNRSPAPVPSTATGKLYRAIWCGVVAESEQEARRLAALKDASGIDWLDPGVIGSVEVVDDLRGHKKLPTGYCHFDLKE